MGKSCSQHHLLIFPITKPLFFQTDLTTLQTELHQQNIKIQSLAGALPAAYRNKVGERSLCDHTPSCCGVIE